MIRGDWATLDSGGLRVDPGSSEAALRKLAWSPVRKTVDLVEAAREVLDDAGEAG